MWNQIVPEGSLAITIPSDARVAPPVPCFPGWTLNLAAGAPGRSAAVCERGTPNVWRFH